MEFRYSNAPFRVLDASHADDRSVWIELWNRWSAREVQAHPAYLERFCEKSQRVLAVVLFSEDGGVLLPIIARPLSDEAWLDASEKRWDLITPYGYGGPFTWGDLPSAAFWNELDTWAQSRHIVGLTARLSLFEAQLLPFEGQIASPMMNVVRTLRHSSEEIWRSYASKVRKNVRKARASGLRVIPDDSGHQLDAFLEIYYSTMKRREAGAGFYFSRDFFSMLLSSLRGNYIFFHVLHEEKIISTELVLLSADTMYSFLGGTISDFFSLRPNDLLKHEAIEWGKEKGMHHFVLGGGYGFEDGIYKYKLAFAPKGSVPFKVGYRSFLPAEEQSLLKTRRDFLASSGQAWHPRENFFPLYRS